MKYMYMQLIIPQKSGIFETFGPAHFWTSWMFWWWDMMSGLWSLFMVGLCLSCWDRQTHSVSSQSSPTTVDVQPQPQMEDQSPPGITTSRTHRHRAVEIFSSNIFSVEIFSSFSFSTLINFFLSSLHDDWIVNSLKWKFKV